MHLEPEMALQNFSPEFSNSFEMITWISKNLPTGLFLLIKEHPEMYGIRSKNYYKKLKEIPNVKFVKPYSSSFELIKNSLAVATITGTAGYEAVYLKKPVLSFGKHQLINYLPTVYYCTNYFDTEKNIKIILKKTKTSSLLKSQSVLFYALYENTFELKDIDKLDDAFFGIKKNINKRLNDLSEWNKLAKTAVNNLNNKLY